MDESQRQRQMIDRSTGQNKNIVNILPFGWIREPTRYASIAKDSTGHRAWLRVYAMLRDQSKRYFVHSHVQNFPGPLLTSSLLGSWPSILVTSLSRRVVSGSVCFSAQFLTEGSTDDQTSRCRKSHHSHFLSFQPIHASHDDQPSYRSSGCRYFWAEDPSRPL